MSFLSVPGRNVVGHDQAVSAAPFEGSRSVIAAVRQVVAGEAVRVGQGGDGCERTSR